MSDEMGEKTEDPTPRRRQEAREEGNIAKSQDLTAGLTLVGAVLLLAAFGSRMLGAMRALVESMLSGAVVENPARGEDLGQLWAVGLQFGLQMFAPVALGLMAMALIAGVLQVGFVVTLKPLTPKFSKVSPIKGLKQLFSLRGLVRLGMSVTKVAVVTGVAAWCIYLDLPKVISLIGLDAEPLLAAAAALVWGLALKVALLLLLLGALDFAYQRWQQEQDMKMSKQEVKEEFKKMEGDPLVKQRRGQVARQLALQRLTHDVPKADVVVTNPTHFAVALQYEGGNMDAPKVVAKGADFLAMRVRQLAAAHGVPIVERPPLARALYRGVEVGQQIPPAHYAAVAEILAYVYRLSGKKTA